MNLKSTSTSAEALCFLAFLILPSIQYYTLSECQASGGQLRECLMTLKWHADRFYKASIDLLKDWHTPGQTCRGTLSFGKKLPLPHLHLPHARNTMFQRGSERPRLRERRGWRGIEKLENDLVLLRLYVINWYFAGHAAQGPFSQDCS